jgi:hypothetical protein
MLALDKDSVRHYDRDKRLHVAKTIISTANVNPYYGREITNWRELGLNPDQIYKLYRDPVELAKAAPTYHNVPLMIRHVAVSPDEPEQESISGTVSNITFEHPHLYGSLAVWTQAGIDSIESGEQEQLSAGYYFKADMTPGTAPTGERYDGRMIDLECNHVAQVKAGRVGPQSTVADEIPPELPLMKSKYPALAEKFKIAAADIVAFDAALDAERQEAEDKAHDNYGCSEDEWSSMDAKARDKARDEWEDKEEKKAKDEAEAEKKKADDKAKDEASKSGKEAFAGSKDSAITMDQVNATVKAATDATRKQVTDLFAAREAVKPLVGVVTFDSAEEVYAFALKHAGVKIEGVHPSAFPALLDAVKGRSEPSKKPVFDASVSAHSIDAIFGARKSA